MFPPRGIGVRIENLISAMPRLQFSSADIPEFDGNELADAVLGLEYSVQAS